MPVGESERSRFKHHLLEKIVGKTTGVASRLDDVTNTVFIDACAEYLFLTKFPQRYRRINLPPKAGSVPVWINRNG